MATLAELEARLAALEALAAVEPLALVPPITIGSLADVPAPGSQIAANWAQEVSTAIVHRFPTKAAIDGWTSAPVGARAVQTDTGVEWRRIAGVWSQVTPWLGGVVGIAASAGQQTVASMTIPADPYIRMAFVSCFLKIDVFSGNLVFVSLAVAGTKVAEALIPKTTQLVGAGVNMDWNIALQGVTPLAAGAASVVTVTVSPDTSSGGVYHTLANNIYNRVDAVVTPRGF
jgi:hypothetical protein